MRESRVTKIEQFMAFGTTVIHPKCLKTIKEKLANDEVIFLGIGDKYNNLKIIEKEDIENVNSVFIAYDTSKQCGLDYVSILCIKTRDENIRDIDRENKIIDKILREKY